MEKVLLGKSGMEVSKIGFGGIPIMRIGEDEAVDVIRRAIDLGIDWLDTARGYSDSEEKIGKAKDSNSIKAVYNSGRISEKKS